MKSLTLFNVFNLSYMNNADVTNSTSQHTSQFRACDESCAFVYYAKVFLLVLSLPLSCACYQIVFTCSKLVLELVCLCIYPVVPCISQKSYGVFCINKSLTCVLTVIMDYLCLMFLFCVDSCVLTPAMESNYDFCIHPMKLIL